MNNQLNPTIAESILNKLLTKKGQFTSAAWSRPCKVKKGAPENIMKSTVMTVRAGIDYDNLKSVQEKRESGALPEENAGLPWGQWKQFPYLIEHKGVDYVRLYPTQGDIQAKVEYFMNGLPVEYEAIESFLLSSEKRKADDKPIDCFTVKLADMIDMS